MLIKTELLKGWPIPSHRCEVTSCYGEKIWQGKPQADWCKIEQYDETNTLVYSEQFMTKSEKDKRLHELWAEFNNGECEL